jgi:hypothetical protein
MEFLKQSWANMVEMEDDEEKSWDTEQHMSHSAPFTMVDSRSKKKTKNPQSSKFSKSQIVYGTRSKVGTSKPFK